MKSGETIKEKDLEHFRLMAQIRELDSGDEITHQTQYVQTEQELIEVRTNTNVVEFVDQGVKTDNEVRDKFCMADIKSNEWYRWHFEVEVQTKNEAFYT